MRLPPTRRLRSDFKDAATVFLVLGAVGLCAVLLLMCGGLVACTIWNLLVQDLFGGPPMRLIHGMAVIVLLYYGGQVVQDFRRPRT